jgi:hypothetical protein
LIAHLRLPTSSRRSTNSEVPVTRATEPSPAALPRWVRLFDALAIVLVVLVVWAVAFDGLRLGLFGFRIRATGAGRLFAQLALVVGIRHWLVPRPTLAHRVWGWLVSFPSRLAAWRERWPTPFAVTPIWLSTRVSVLIVGYLAVVLIGYPDGEPPWRLSSNEFWNLPARWDTGWYLGIARDGYTWNPNEASQQNLNFFPALPMAMRAGGLFADDALSVAWIGVLIAMLAFLAALVYLHRLMVSLAHASAAPAAVMLMATYPFALFFSAAYSESLYLVGAVGAFYHLRTRQYWGASAWGLLAGLSRPNGGLLAIPLAAMALVDARKRRHAGEQRRASGWSLRRVQIVPALAACTPIAGTLLYSAGAYQLTGRPFIWATLQQKAWGRTFQGLDASLIEPLSDMQKLGFIEHTTREPIETLYLAAALFAIGSIWPVLRRFGLPYALLVAVNTFAALFAGGLTSMGRFTAVLFPVFMWLGAVVPAAHLPAWTAAFAMGQAIAAAAFFTWRHIF